MFNNCTALTEMPELPSTSLAEECYSGMFGNCTGLTKAHQLPATTLVQGCYRYMFKNCTSLQASPLLPAPKLVDFCYEQMFSGCSSLSKVTCLINDFNDAWWGIYYWLSGVSPTGTFVMAKGMQSQWPVGGEFGFPAGWTIEEIGTETDIQTIDDHRRGAAPYYNLSGRYVASPSQGLYIYDGKKVLLRK